MLRSWVLETSAGGRLLHRVSRFGPKSYEGLTIIRHGGGKKCRMSGCTKVVQHNGLCVAHGGFRMCSTQDCKRRAHSGKLCSTHAAELKKASAVTMSKPITPIPIHTHYTSAPTSASLRALPALSIAQPTRTIDVVQYSGWSRPGSVTASSGEETLMPPNTRVKCHESNCARLAKIAGYCILHCENSSGGSNRR